MLSPVRQNGSGCTCTRPGIHEWQETPSTTLMAVCISDTAMYYLGGLLSHAKEICAIINSNVNSFKRLVPGYEAPCYISWANMNRSALIRVPAGRV